MEAVCKAHEYHSTREHYGVILAKNPEYFLPSRNYAWPKMLEPIANSIPQVSNEHFRFVTTAGDGPSAPAFEPGVTSIGKQSQAGWFKELSKSKLLVSRLFVPDFFIRADKRAQLGIGSPPVSPSRKFTFIE